MNGRQIRCSVLAPSIAEYVSFKRALGRSYANEERVLQYLDSFLVETNSDLTSETFARCNCLGILHSCGWLRDGEGQSSSNGGCDRRGQKGDRVNAAKMAGAEDRHQNGLSLCPAL
jgi:hypothetical protein